MQEHPKTEWMSGVEVAAAFQVNQSTISRWADRGLIPSHLLPSGTRRYRRDEIEPMINGNDRAAS